MKNRVAILLWAANPAQPHLCATPFFHAAVAAAMDAEVEIYFTNASVRLLGKGVAVALPAMTSLKLQLYWALRAAGITRAELARRLKWNRESVDRLFRLGHRSRLEQIEAAFAALGRKVDVSTRKAA